MFVGARGLPGVEPDRDAAQRVMNAMRENGVLVGVEGPFGNVIEIRPPMPLAVKDADLLVRALEEALEATLTRSSKSG